MTKEQYLNDRIAELRTLLAEGLEQNKIEVTEKSERLIQSFLENTISGYKAINEKSYFDEELDKIDNGWGAVGEKLGHDNIGGHEVVKPVERWKPAMASYYWHINSDGLISEGLWDDGMGDILRYEFHNCFETKQEALAARERVKKALLG